MSVMDLSPVIGSLGTGKVRVTRASATTWVDGDAVPGSTSRFWVDAIVQPMPQEEVRRLPEGDRPVEPVVIFTRRKLKAASVAEQTPGDLIDYGGCTYEVLTVGNWSAQSNHYRCTAGRIDAG